MNNIHSETRETFGLQEKTPRTISMLINAAYYFIECVFILDLQDHYRLVALHNRRVLTDARYKSLRGARIAFAKLYKDKAWREGVKAQWTDFYDPDALWLEKRTRVLKTCSPDSPILKEEGKRVRG